MYTSNILLVVFLCLFFTNGAWAEQVIQLNEVVVVGKLDKARDSIVPSLGATEYNIGHGQIANQSEGDNASFNQVILRAPGAAEDSFGQLHVRGEHANLQYRINDILLPEGISGFGQELDTRFLDNVSLITGSLPAQFGYRTAGIIDIHTKSGVFNNGGSVSMYGGSYNALNPSLTYGGNDPKKDINYYVTASYLENDLGVENPTGSHNPIHDQTQQGKAFAYVSKVVDDTSRVNVMASGSHADFEIPNNPGQTTAFTLNGVSSFDSKNLNERQTEQNYYATLTYQKAIDNLNFQLSAFNRESEVLFRPDINGDLMFNGVASRVDNNIISNGLQLDGSYQLNDKHTLRTGSLLTISEATNNNTSTVFPADSAGTQISSTPFNIVDNHHKEGKLYGIYLQDEWKIFEPLTVNFGGRFDQSYQYVNEYQFSPRFNTVYEVDKGTTVHAGYARYFTPPPLERVQSVNPHIYDNTTNVSAVTQNSTIKSERSHYFDAGITHNFSPEFKMGLDSYYKIAKNQLDDGQFGAAIITTPFNYKKGKVYGTELTANYKKGGFSGYGNVAYSRAMGKEISSGEFLFSQDKLNYVAKNWVHLDHDQSLTASTGVSYAFYNTSVYADLLFGSGLRRGFANTKRVGAYNPVNIGIEHTFKLNNKQNLKARFDVVNLFDEVYELRDGTGIGVGAPQFGQRRGFYGGMSLDF